MDRPLVPQPDQQRRGEHVPGPSGVHLDGGGSGNLRGRASRTTKHRPAAAPGHGHDGEREVGSFWKLRLGNGHEVETRESLDDFRRPTDRDSSFVVPATQQTLESGSGEGARSVEAGQGTGTAEFIGDWAVEDCRSGRKFSHGAADFLFRDDRRAAQDRLFPRAVCPVAVFEPGPVPGGHPVNRDSSETFEVRERRVGRGQDRDPATEPVGQQPRVGGGAAEPRPSTSQILGQVSDNEDAGPRIRRAVRAPFHRLHKLVLSGG